QSIIYSYENAIFPVYLFSKRSRGKFRYKLLGKSPVPSMGRNAYVIEVRSASAQSEVLTVAWVDDRDFSILKFQVYPSAFQGYNHIINSGTGDLTDVSIDDVHYFGVQNGGLRFPSKTDILLKFTHKTGKQYDLEGRLFYEKELNTQLHTTYSYDKYTFFNVSVDDPVFK
ncbi:MAG: hypothetical protein GY940_09505, partial [bacterium]|nr:hypothetical protein [bacterium]